jgi:hypothetical protein
VYPKAEEMANSVNIISRYFGARDIDIGPDEIVVVSCLRNEIQRLPYFLDYYRALGVNRFLIVDNNSTDGSGEYLLRQPDVESFSTPASYRGSCAGRLWMQELAETYAMDRWVVTADVDELLVFPGRETLDLHDLCEYLEQHRYAGLFTVMLDMYSDRPLAQTVYKPGTDFLETCPFFEPDTYEFRATALPPFLGVHGGPRGRLFAAHGKIGDGPVMKKVPLVKWHPGFSYVFSTHSHRYLRLADITGLLLHFKFFSSFGEVAAVEASRGDRRRPSHYSTYQSIVEDDLCFFGAHSHRYEGPQSFVRLGMMCTTPPYRDFVARRLHQDASTSPGPDVDAEHVEALLPPSEPVMGMTLRAMSTLWPLVNNHGVARFFGHAQPAVPHRAAFIWRMQRHVRVIDVHSDHLLVKLGEVALHGWERSGLALAVYAGDRLVRRALIDGSDPTFEVDIDSLEAGIFRLKADIGAVARPLLDHGRVTVTVYLIDGTDEGRMQDHASQAETGTGPDDVLIHSCPWHPAGLTTAEARRFDGMIERLDEGTLVGWAYDALEDRFNRPLTVYVNGRFTRQVTPLQRRRRLRFLRGRPSAFTGRGFAESLPLGYFEESGAATLKIEAYIAGTNVALRRSPLLLPAGAANARWDAEARTWISGDAVFDGLARRRSPAPRRAGPASARSIAQVWRGRQRKRTPRRLVPTSESELLPDSPADLRSTR